MAAGYRAVAEAAEDGGGWPFLERVSFSNALHGVSGIGSPPKAPDKKQHGRRSEQRGSGLRPRSLSTAGPGAPGRHRCSAEASTQKAKLPLLFSQLGHCGNELLNCPHSRPMQMQRRGAIRQDRECSSTQAAQWQAASVGGLSAGPHFNARGDPQHNGNDGGADDADQAG